MAMRAPVLACQLDDFDYQQRATCGLWLFSARSMALKDAFAFARDYGGDPRASSMARRTVNLLSQGFLDVASEASRKAVDEARNASQPTVLCVSLAWAAGFIALSLGELQVANDYGEELVGLTLPACA